LAAVLAALAAGTECRPSAQSTEAPVVPSARRGARPRAQHTGKMEDEKKWREGERARRSARARFLGPL